jgi:hypothetical protein
MEEEEKDIILLLLYELLAANRIGTVGIYLFLLSSMVCCLLNKAQRTCIKTTVNIIHILLYWNIINYNMTDENVYRWRQIIWYSNGYDIGILYGYGRSCRFFNHILNAISLLNGNTGVSIILKYRNTILHLLFYYNIQRM